MTLTTQATQIMNDDLDTFTQMNANAERYGYLDLGLHSEGVRLYQCTGCANVVAVKGQVRKFTPETNMLVKHAVHCGHLTLGLRVVRAEQAIEQEQT